MSVNISIFAKRAFLNTNPHHEFISKEKSYRGYGHLQRVSSMIRGDQISEYLGAKLNPTTGYKKDVCIYVKPHVRGEENIAKFKFEGTRAYLDIVDAWGLLPLLERHPEVGVIACSKRDQQILSKLLKNEIIFIPQHHCNFERVKRDSDKIETIGMIGTDDAFKYLPPEIEEGLGKLGVKLVKYSKFFSRQDVIDFYKQIDIQVVWRPYRMRLSNPLKLVNAASLGVPTIAYDEDVFQELEDCYFGVKSYQEFLNVVNNLKHSIGFYQEFSDYIVDKAEEYHIEKVGELYKKL